MDMSCRQCRSGTIGVILKQFEELRDMPRIQFGFVTLHIHNVVIIR